MAQIDQFLKVMLEQPDAEFFLETDAEPQLRVHGRVQPLIKRKLTAPQIRFLMKEITTEADNRVLDARGSAEIVYTPPGEQAVFVVVRAWAADVEVAFRPAGAMKAPSAIPPKSAPDLDNTLGAVPRMSPPAKSEARVAPEPPPPSMPMSAGRIEQPIHTLFRLMVKMKASDLHLSTGEKPMIRKDGDMERFEHMERFTAQSIAAMVYPIVPEAAKAQFEMEKDADFAYEVEGLSRFRGNIFYDRFGMGAVFRTIPTKIVTAEELGLSASIQNLCYLSKGLVLVTGPTGSGKSTTLASLIDLINRTRNDHIITIEDPIEFVHPNKKCLVNQREVGEHTQSFKRALRAALREDPDIVLVGEMRDLETVAIAIETAETGHLVFGTLHTSTAYSTIDRIIDQFPADQQEQIRVMLSGSLKAVISQTLCKKIGGGRVAALEVLLVNAAVANLIREGKTFQIPSIMQTQRKFGMVVMNDALMDHVQAKRVELKEAYIKAIDKTNFIAMAKAAGHTFDFLQEEAVVSTVQKG
jgi:twitching motility protein PilT